MPPKRGTKAYDRWRKSDKYQLFVEDRTGKKNPFYDHQHTEENKRKQSEFRRGGWVGEKNPNYGGINIPWNKNKKGVQVSWNKGRKNPALSERNRQRSGEKHPFFGKKRPHHAELMRGRMIGEKNPCWIDGRSHEPYTSDWTYTLRAAIRQRDDCICQNCGCLEAEEGKRLAVHHIDYDKKNCNPTNLITLCQFCNAKANKDRKRWTHYFQEKMLKQVER